MKGFTNVSSVGTDLRTRKVERMVARAEHLVLKLATITIGAAYIKFTNSQVVSRWRNQGMPRPVFPGRVALVAHVYYTDLIDEILACYASLPLEADLIVTTPSNTRQEAANRLARLKRVKVIEVPNRGRDIAPFLSLLNDGVLDKFDVVLKIHTKRSPHLRDGNIRRKLIFAGLAGSHKRATQALQLFENPAVGLVGWKPCWRNSRFYWMKNCQWAEKITTRMAIPLPEEPAFFEGSMFWVRPSALERLRALNLSTSDFESEAGQTDGALHHAIERVFCLAVAGGGYVVRDCKGVHLFGPCSASSDQTANCLDEKLGTITNQEPAQASN